MTSDKPTELSMAAEQSLPSSWLTADRQDWQLWLLTVSVIIVLGGGLMSFMFPSVFWSNNSSLFQAQDKAFYGFCLMMALSLSHVLQKQSALRKMRHDLVRERYRREQELIHNTLHDSLTNLPNRALLMDRVERCITGQQRRKDSGDKPKAMQENYH